MTYTRPFHVRTLPSFPSHEGGRDEFCALLAGLREAGDYAVQHDVEFAIEPLNRFETDFCNTARQAVELVTQVGSPAGNVTVKNRCLVRCRCQALGRLYPSRGMSLNDC